MSTDSELTWPDRSWSVFLPSTGPSLAATAGASGRASWSSPSVREVHTLMHLAPTADFLWL